MKIKIYKIYNWDKLAFPPDLVYLKKIKCLDCKKVYDEYGKVYDHYYMSYKCKFCGSFNVSGK